MSVNINPNLFARGFKIDTQPLVNLVTKDLAAKKAAKEATIKNANDLYKGLNPAGVRPQDLNYPDDPTKGIMPDMVNWYNEAKAGNIDFGKYKELLYNIERSKEIGKQQLEIGAKTQEGKIEPEPEDIQKLHQKDLSIFATGNQDPTKNHYNWQQGDLTQFVPTFDEKKFFGSVFGEAKPDVNLSKKTLDKETQRYFVPKEFTPGEEKRFGDIAAASIINDRSAQKEFKKQIKNPAFLESALPAYMSVYGQIKLEDFTPDKAAAAAAILRARQMKETVPYTVPKVDDWKDKMLFANKLKKGFAAYRHGLGATDDEGILNKYVEDRYKEGSGLYDILNYGGKKYSGKHIDVPIEIRYKYGIKVGEKDVLPDEFLMTEDKKKVIPLFYKKDKNGNNYINASGKQELDQTITSKPIDIQNFKVNIGQMILPRKTFGGEVVGDESFSEGTPGSYESSYSTEGGSESGTTPVVGSPQSKPVKPTTGKQVTGKTGKKIIVPE
jgi:hypothetical protein